MCIRDRTKGKIAHSQALRDSAPAGAGRVTYAKVLKNALRSTKQPSIKSFFKAKDINKEVQAVEKVKGKKVNLGDIQFRHLNNQKSEPSMDFLNLELEKLKNFITMGNEPNCLYNRIRGLNRRHNLIYNYTDPKGKNETCLLYTSPSPRDATLSRMPSSA